jgi:hypothetical protein
MGKNFYRDCFRTHKEYEIILFDKINGAFVCLKYQLMTHRWVLIPMDKILTNLDSCTGIVFGHTKSDTILFDKKIMKRVLTDKINGAFVTVSERRPLSSV